MKEVGHSIKFEHPLMQPDLIAERAENQYVDDNSNGAVCHGGDFEECARKLQINANTANWVLHVSAGGHNFDKRLW